MHKITPYRLPMRRIAVLLLAAAVTTGVLGACGPVTPHATISTSTFEGFDVVSYVPEHPVGLAYVFHGSYGSADFATKVETVDTLNELVDRGYGFIATESTLRTGNKRWNVFDPSLTTNADLARLVRLHDHFVDTTAITAYTPLVGIGMSNGARFVSLWGQEWADAGYPVRAIAMYMGTIAPPVETTGGLSVPTFFVAAANDSTSPPWPIAVDQATTAAQGTPSELIVAAEQPLSARASSASRGSTRERRMRSSKHSSPPARGIRKARGSCPSPTRPRGRRPRACPRVSIRCAARSRTRLRSCSPSTRCAATSRCPSPSSSPNSSEGVLSRAVTTTLPARAYLDPDLYAAERARIFATQWQLAAFRAQFREPGDYAAHEFAGWRVVVVVQDDGTLRAFHNVCRHRAGPLVTEPNGHCTNLVCRYHGWSYARDGSLNSARDFGADDLDASEFGLLPVRVEDGAASCSSTSTRPRRA